MRVQQQWHKPSWIYLFAPLSLLFLFFSYRNRASYEPSSKVWLVGNLAVGGTGKTPFTIALANWLTQSRSKKVVILARGYKASVVEPTQVTEVDIAKYGDEACMMFLQGHTVFVSASRVKGITHILATLPQTDIIISDDGLQHKNLKYAKAFLLPCLQKNHWLLPVGPKRMPRFLLPPGVIELKQQQLPAKIIGFRHSITKDITDTLPNKMVILVAGIANPKRFAKMMLAKGYQIKEQFYPDHYDFSLNPITNSKDIFVITEKDASKIKPQANLFVALYELTPDFQTIID